MTTTMIARRIGCRFSRRGGRLGGRGAVAGRVSSATVKLVVGVRDSGSAARCIKVRRR